ncbi:MAG: hypothetical protein E6Q97_36460 [Desulfurellales bacterium]|nr:MAG: hypothetical protein E6Q97_36460 [Desulfurellales bacterium]
MEFIKPLLELIQVNPLLFMIALPTVGWWLERSERISQQKVHSEIQQEVIDSLKEVEKAINHNSLLLQFMNGKIFIEADQ